MKAEEFDFDSIGCLSSIAEELLLIEDDPLMKSLGEDIDLAYRVLAAKKKLQGGDYGMDAYVEKILSLLHSNVNKGKQDG